MTDLQPPPGPPTTGDGPGADKVSPVWIAAAAAYLVVLTAASTASLWNQFPRCDLPEPPRPASSVVAPAVPGDEAGVARNAAAAGPIRVDSVQPSTLTVAGGHLVTIFGTGFEPNTRVFFDGVPAPDVKVEGSRFLLATAPPHGPGPVSVVVAGDLPPATLMGAVTYVCPAVSETKLVVLVLLAGALGGLVHALRSLFWYVGHRQLVWSWMLMYLLLPVTSALLAFMFFLLARAGLYQPTTEGSLVFVGLAALVGMFSTQAAQKLKDIAEGIFTKADRGANHVPPTTRPADPPKSDVLPKSGPAAGGTDVTISGTAAAAGVTVSFGETASTAVRIVDPSTVVATTPAHAVGIVDVTIATPGREADSRKGAFTFV